MKKNFVQKLALGLALVMTVTSVPVSSEAAAKPAFKTTSVEVKEGETVKAVVKGTKGYTVKKVASKNETVATVAKVGQKAKKVNVKVTGVAAGETKVVAKLAKGGKVVKAKLNVTVEAAKVESVPEIKELKAEKVNKLVATFASAVNTEDVSLKLTKGTSAVENAVTWNGDKTVATITTVAKMTAGTYTLTATAASDSVSKTADVVIEDQTVAEIIIKDTVALTGKADISVPVDGIKEDAGEAYVYYDVVDQYGESLRTSASITWSTSCGTPVEDRTLGRLTLTRSDNKAFTYGEQIFVAGVNAQTGKSVNATLTVGAEQALNSVEVKGFVKKNTTEILSTLPSGFKSGAYYMVYSVVDQNENPMEADYFLNASNASGTQQVTFISDNVLVIKEFTETGRLITIDGITYSAANVVPGLYVDKGGEVNITAIANKTGNKTNLNTVVGEYAVLQSFVMSSPELFADGEIKEIPFVATDVNGNEIKNFNVLANNINKLTFSSSDNTVLKLSEKADGTAKLTLDDSLHNASATPIAGWSTDSTDGIDRPVALTAIVVGGETNNLMVNIKDKARPDAIYSVTFDEAILEGTTEQINFTDARVIVNGKETEPCSFTYLDQYGRKITDPYNVYPQNDNGFFAASANNQLSGLAFAGYEYGVQVTYKGNVNAVTGSAITDIALSGNGVKRMANVNGVTVLYINADSLTQTAITGENLRFEIAKYKAAEGWNSTSTATNKTFAIVDITQVKNLAVADLSKQYVGTDMTVYATGAIGGVTDGAINVVVNSGNLDNTNHTQTVKVTGTFNGKTVTVPSTYFTLTAMDNKMTVSGNKIMTDPGTRMTYGDLYDATTAKLVRKDAKDTLKVDVNEIFNNTPGAGFGTAIVARVYDSVTKPVVLSDANFVPAVIVSEDKATFAPSGTQITDLDPVKANTYGVDTLLVLDQYSKPMLSATYAYQVSKITENKAGYAENNCRVQNNGQASATVIGAERGDTFVLTITATVGTDYITKDVTATVGADGKADISGSTNNYVDYLIDIDGINSGIYGLEYQRVAGLQ